MKRWVWIVSAVGLVACAENDEPRGPADDAGSVIDAGDRADADVDMDAGVVEDAGADDAGARDGEQPDAKVAGDGGLDELDAAHEEAGSALDAPSADAESGDAEPDSMEAGADGGVTCTTDAATAQAPLDLIVALDTSFSMAPLICYAGSNLAALLNGLPAGAHVVGIYDSQLEPFTQPLCGWSDPLIGSPLAMDASRYLRINTPVDSNNAFSVLLSQYDNYAQRLRPGAQTHVLVVSDDNSTTESTVFRQELEQKLGHGFTFHAAVATGESCLGFAVGAEYMDLATATGGVTQPLCDVVWSPLLTRLAAQPCTP